MNKLDRARLRHAYTRYAPVREGWGDHPKTFIGPLRNGEQECVEFSFTPWQRKKLHKKLSSVRETDDAAKEAFIDDLEWALTGSLAAQIVTARAKDWKATDAQLVKDLVRPLGAVVDLLRKAASPDRPLPLELLHPSGRFLPPEFIKEIFLRVECLYQCCRYCIEGEKKGASKNRGGRPRDWTRHKFIKQAVEDYRARFTAWPPATRKGPFLAVLRIALKAADRQPVFDLSKEVREILRDLKA